MKDLNLSQDVQFGCCWHYVPNEFYVTWILHLKIRRHVKTQSHSIPPVSTEWVWQKTRSQHGQTQGDTTLQVFQLFIQGMFNDYIWDLRNDYRKMTVWKKITSFKLEEYSIHVTDSGNNLPTASGCKWHSFQQVQALQPCSHGCKPGGLQINGHGMMAYSDGLVLCEQMVGTTPSQLDLTKSSCCFPMVFESPILESCWVSESSKVLSKKTRIPKTRKVCWPNRPNKKGCI